MRPSPTSLVGVLSVLAATVVLYASGAAKAQEAVDLPASITFATSTGYWEDDGNLPKVEQAPGTPAADGDATGATPAAPRHGYYKLYAVRQPDRTAKVYLQQVVLGDDGPRVMSTTELREITALKGFVTDIRPESPDGLIREPGLFATVLLKRQPDADPEGWNVVIDELGEISVEKAAL